MSRGRPEVDAAMAPLFGKDLGSEIYNPIYEAVSALLQDGHSTRADRLIRAIDSLAKLSTFKVPRERQ